MCRVPFLAGGVPVTVELEEKDRFRLTKEKVLEKLTPKTKILVLPFPNNPTGSILEKEDLEAIADVVREKDLFVISDEIYSELTYGRHHCTIAALPGMKERTVLINGFSKSYAMTGWRLGYACAPEAIPEADAEDPPVCHHVRAHHQPVCGGGGLKKRRPGRGGDAGGL